jgi:hypothetical protein
VFKFRRFQGMKILAYSLSSQAPHSFLSTYGATRGICKIHWER